MKKHFLFFVAFAFMVIASSGQTIVNNTNKAVTVKSSDNMYELPNIPPHKSMSAPFLKEGPNNIQLWYYDGMTEVKVGLTTVTLEKNNKAVISQANFTTPAKAAVKEQASYAPASDLRPGTAFTTQLRLGNTSTHSFIVRTDPFTNMCLAPGQNSKETATVKLGQMELTLKIDYENDSATSNKGRRYRQVVISTMIHQDQTELNISDANLTQMGGNQLWRRVKNSLPYDFQFVSGPWYGEALATGEVGAKAQLNKGFNSLAIQWIYNGTKYQADAEILVTSRNKIISINESMLKNKIVIK